MTGGAAGTRNIVHLAGSGSGGFCTGHRGRGWENCVLRIVVVLWLAVAAILSLPATAAAESRLDRVRTAGVMRVCIWPDYYGITYRNPKTGELSGIDIDMAGQLARDLGVGVRFIDSSFADLLTDLSRDACDIAMFAIGVTPARTARLRFTSPYLASDIYAITTKTNRRIRGWDDIDKPGTVVAVARGTLHETVMKERLKSADLLVLDTPFAREQEVQAGRADVFMTDYPYSRRFLANVDWARLVEPPAPYHVTPYAYAVLPGDDAWYARAEQFVHDVKSDGRLMAAAKRHKLDTIVVTR